MIYKVFTVFDSKSDVFMPPFFCKSIGEAERIVTDLVRNKEHQFYRYSTDFLLFELGTYDDSIGQFENLVAPKSLAILSEYCRVVDES